eukprot:7513636-Pyramimonas_sp.AAC.1
MMTRRHSLQRAMTRRAGVVTPRWNRRSGLALCSALLNSRSFEIIQRWREVPSDLYSDQFMQVFDGEREALNSKCNETWSWCWAPPLELTEWPQFMQ